VLSAIAKPPGVPVGVMAPHSVSLPGSKPGNSDCPVTHLRPFRHLYDATRPVDAKQGAIK
jgi:hypothetical protein